MATRRPLVLNDGLVSELLDGDTVRAGTSTTEVVAGSGLTGGGSVSTNPELDLALAPNPSGIIYVGDALGIDGAAGVTADIALASGSAAAVLASNALASGNNSLVVASAALASGNAALDLVPTLGGGGGGTVVELTAASAVASGYAVGFDDGGNVQSVRSVVTDNTNPMSFPSAAVVFESASSIYISTTYDSTNNKIVIAYRDVGNSSYGTAIVGTVSGTSISFGTAVVFESATSAYISTTYDSTNNKIVIAYQDGGNSATAPRSSALFPAHRSHSAPPSSLNLLTPPTSPPPTTQPTTKSSSPTETWQLQLRHRHRRHRLRHIDLIRHRRRF
jgi:hypothetical protein